jgi:hypothetical protein
VLVETKGFNLIIVSSWDKPLVNFRFPCENPVILETISYVEYWRYDEPGSFFYYGYVTIDDPTNLRGHDDLYYKSPELPFGLYLIHHNWGRSVYDKGEVDDR